MKAIILTCLSAVCLCAQTTPKAPAAKPAPVTKSAPRPGATARRKPLMLNPAAYRAKAPETFRAKFSATKGDFIVEVHRAWAPLGADRFYNLVKGGYYDGAPIYRVIPNFMAQFGFSPNPAVSKAWDKAAIKDDPVLQSNKRGTVSYAKPDMPNARTTQIFINYADNTPLDSQGFAPFGTVVEGMDVVEKFFGGYGDTDQQKLEEQGIAYVKKSLPNLDIVNSAVLEPAAPAAAPPKPHAATK